MMAFDAPGPGRRVLHGSKSEETDAKLIRAGVDAATSMLDRLRGADPIDSGDAITAEGCRHEQRPCRSLVQVEVTEPKAGSWFRKIGPLDSIGGGDRCRCLRSRRVIKGLQEGLSPGQGIAGIRETRLRHRCREKQAGDGGGRTGSMANQGRDETVPGDHS